MFVELTPRMVVDPVEVVAIEGAGPNATKVYLAGTGMKDPFVIERPFAEVAHAISDGRKYSPVFPPP